MKKNLLFLMLMVVLFPLTMKAQEIIVGEATTDKNLAPFLNSYQNSWLEMVYTAEEIGQACTIGSIAFQYVGGPILPTNDLRIYLAETDKEKFMDKTDWTPEEELTLVYSGTNVQIGGDEWETFELDTPFEYSGEKNLAVVVAKTAEYFELTLTWACYSYAGGVMFTGNVNGDHDTSFAQYPTGEGLAIYNYKPVMKLVEREPVAELAAPTNLRAYVRQDVEGFGYKYEVTMAWDAVEGADGYDVFVNTATAQDFHMGYTNGTAYVAGTDKEGTLEFYVVAFNDETESAPSETCTIVIEYDAIEELSSSLNIYPNPANDNLFIETEMNVEEVVVFDVDGRQQSTVNGQQSVDVSNLSNGVYFVKVRTENGEVVKRFVKK